MVTTAGAYCRISRDKSGQRIGVERQEPECRSLAATLGWEVRNVYVDNDISAYSGKRRPRYEALLADIASGLITGVVAWHPDRLHRTLGELEVYIDLSEIHDVPTYTAQAGGWDLSTPAGRLQARVICSFARYESEHRSARVTAASKANAVKGGWHGGRRPYGWEPNGLDPRPDEAAEIVGAYQHIAAGGSVRALVQSFNERNVPTTDRKGPWTSRQMRVMLLRPRHAGLRTYQGEIIGAAQWPPLVDHTLWHQVQDILTDPARRTNHRSTQLPRWLGSGIYRCGVCGSTKHMRARIRSGEATVRRRYRCDNRVKGAATQHVGRDVDLTDRLVEAAMVAHLSDPAVLATLLAIPDSALDIPQLREDVSRHKQRLTEAADLFASGAITAEQLATISAACRTQITEREFELNQELATAAQPSPLSIFTPGDDIAAIWYGLGGADGDRVGGLDIGARREIIRWLADVVILPVPAGPFRPDYIRISWKHGARS